MKLVYTATGVPVKAGDIIARGGLDYEISYFRPPHKPSSSGLVTIRHNGLEQEFYVSVIGAEWIDREDRA